MMTDSQLARLASKSARLVRRCERAYDRAIRAEENAPTEAKAWRLAKVSERCLRDLQAVRAGLPLPEAKLPRTARNMAKQGLAALATIGRVIARALRTAAALRKAQVAAALARAARKIAQVARQAARRALRTVARRALLAVTVTTNKEISMVNVPTLAQRITAGHGHNYAEVAVDGTLLRYTIIVEPGVYRPLGVQLRGDRFVFSGGFQGEHSLAADELITSAARLLAHWEGYVDNNAQYVDDACTGYFTRLALIERCTVGGAS